MKKVLCLLLTLYIPHLAYAHEDHDIRSSISIINNTQVTISVDLPVAILPNSIWKQITSRPIKSIENQTHVNALKKAIENSPAYISIKTKQEACNANDTITTEWFNTAQQLRVTYTFNCSSTLGALTFDYLFFERLCNYQEAQSIHPSSLIVRSKHKAPDKQLTCPQHIIHATTSQKDNAYTLEYSSPKETTCYLPFIMGTIIILMVILLLFLRMKKRTTTKQE